eukprot:422561_1
MSTDNTINNTSNNEQQSPSQPSKPEALKSNDNENDPEITMERTGDNTKEMPSESMSTNANDQTKSVIAEKKEDEVSGRTNAVDIDIDDKKQDEKDEILEDDEEKYRSLEQTDLVHKEMADATKTFSVQMEESFDLVKGDTGNDFPFCYKKTDLNKFLITGKHVILKCDFIEVTNDKLRNDYGTNWDVFVRENGDELIFEGDDIQDCAIMTYIMDTKQFVLWKIEKVDKDNNNELKMVSVVIKKKHILGDIMVFSVPPRCMFNIETGTLNDGRCEYTTRYAIPWVKKGGGVELKYNFDEVTEDVLKTELGETWKDKIKEKSEEDNRLRWNDEELCRMVFITYNKDTSNYVLWEIYISKKYQGAQIRSLIICSTETDQLHFPTNCKLKFVADDNAVYNPKKYCFVRLYNGNHSKMLSISGEVKMRSEIFGETFLSKPVDDGAKFVLKCIKNNKYISVSDGKLAVTANLEDAESFCLENIEENAFNLFYLEQDGDNLGIDKSGKIVSLDPYDDEKSFRKIDKLSFQVMLTEISTALDYKLNCGLFQYLSTENDYVNTGKLVILLNHLFRPTHVLVKEDIGDLKEPIKVEGFYQGKWESLPVEKKEPSDDEKNQQLVYEIAKGSLCCSKFRTNYKIEEMYGELKSFINPIHAQDDGSSNAGLFHYFSSKDDTAFSIGTSDNRNNKETSEIVGLSQKISTYSVEANDNKEAYIVVDLKNNFLTPVGYSLRNNANGDGEWMKGWKLEGSVNHGRDWQHVIDEQTDNDELKGNGTVKCFDIEQTETIFNAFRLSVNQQTNCGDWNLKLSGFELY